MKRAIHNIVRRVWEPMMQAIDRSPAAIEDKLRLKYFSVFVLIGLPIMAMYGVYNLLGGRYLLVCMVVISGTGLAAGLLVLLRHRAGKAVYRINGLLFCALLLYMLILGGEDGSKILWIYIFPLIAFFLVGRREGMAWSGTLLMAALILFFLPDHVAAIHAYGNEFIVRFLSTYVIICTVTFWFEHFRTGYRRQLEIEHQRFVDILEHSREVLYRRDLASGNYIYISKAFFALLGIEPSPGENSYQQIETLIHPDDRDRHDLLLRKIVAKDPSIADREPVIEYRMRHRDGRYLWFSDQIAVIENRHGQPAAIVGCNREVSEQRRLKQAVEEVRDQLLTILDSIDAHIYVADMASYEILFMNSKMRKDFGQNFEGGLCWKEFRNGEKPCEHCTNPVLLDDDQHPTGVYEWECFNPITRRWYNNYDRAIRWVDEKWVRIQIAVDISRIKEMEKERQQHQEALRKARQFEAIGTLAGGMAHDFNNILQIVLGNLSLLEADCDRTSDHFKYLQEIRQASGRAREVANRLVTFSTGGVPKKVPLSVRRLVQEAANERFGDNGDSFHLDMADDLWTVSVDPEQIALVLKSVLDNACDSMPDGGVVDIGVHNHVRGPQDRSDGVPTAEGKYLKISIRDQGAGIAESDLGKVFEPYYSTKQKGTRKGQGLSLSIVRSVVEQHGGFVLLSSQLRQGTTVAIYLPADERTAASAPHAGHTRPLKATAATNNRILVMDDEAMICRLAVKMFARLGYRVDVARHGQEAIDRYHAAFNNGERYMLTVLDLTVQEGMGGRKALEALQNVDPDIKAIVSSGYSNDDVIKNFAQYGFIGALAKPYTLDQVRSLLRRLIAEGHFSEPN